jgi:hypothetical protein
MVRTGLVATIAWTVPPDASFEFSKRKKQTDETAAIGASLV